MKKGISLISLIVVIIVMMILGGVVLLQDTGTTQVVALNKFAVELLNIQNAVDEYHYRYEKYPVTSDYTLDTTTIQTEFHSQFNLETITNDTISFKIVDLSLIGINDTEFGLGEGTDIYVVSETTGKVYYIKGFPYEEEIYYTLTNELYIITEVKSDEGLSSSNDIKIYDVIFTPNSLNYTNEPVIVEIKLPVNATFDEITTTEDKSISSENIQGTYKVVTINETSTNKEGNYIIQVNYTYNGVTKLATYQVTNFDNIAPTLSVTEKENGNAKTVNITATDDSSGIKSIKYEDEIISDESYFENYGTEVTNNQFVIASGGWYTIWIQDKAGNVTVLNNIPDDWRTNVIDIVDDVPIPKGFVASHATGENNKSAGLVIYEGSEAVTNGNVENAKRNRNQYVWVPVEDFTKFVRKNWGLNDTTGKVVTISNVLGTNQWEVELDVTTNLPLSTQSSTTYLSSTTLAEVQAMYASVKEYGGFYIARYEAGIDNQRTSNAALVTGTNVHSKMNKIPYTYVPWGASTLDDTSGAVQVARGLYQKTNENYGVVSTLTYGVQWDATMRWWMNTRAVASVMSSAGYGNYNDKIIISADDLNDGAQVAVYDNSTGDLGSYVAKASTTLIYPKASGTSWGLSTGALKVACVNNIYDMAGNVMEWTMEGSSTNYRARCGGYFSSSGATGGYPVGIRSNGNPSGAYLGIGFRTALYIKK